MSAALLLCCLHGPAAPAPPPPHSVPRPSAASLATFGIPAGFWPYLPEDQARLLLARQTEIRDTESGTAARLRVLEELLRELPPGALRPRIARAAAGTAAGLGRHAEAAGLYLEATNTGSRGLRREAGLRAAEQGLLGGDAAVAARALEMLDRFEPTIDFDERSVNGFVRRLGLWARVGRPGHAVDLYLASSPEPGAAARLQRYAQFGSLLSEGLDEELSYRLLTGVLRRSGGHASPTMIERVRRESGRRGHRAREIGLAEVGVRFFPDRAEAVAQRELLREAAAARGDAAAAAAHDRAILEHPQAEPTQRFAAADRLGEIFAPNPGAAARGPIAPVPDPAFTPSAGREGES